MALDSVASLILNGIKPVEIEDPTSISIKKMQLKNLLSQGKANEFELGQRQQEAQRASKLRELLSSTDPDQRIPTLERSGYLNEANALRKNAAEEEDRKLGNASKWYDLVRKSAGSVMANPTLDNAIQQTMLLGQLTGKPVDMPLQQLQQIGDNPDALRRWAAGHALEAEKLLPRSDKVDSGQAIIDRTVDPLTGLASEVGRTQKMATPDAIMTDKRTREEGAANRGVSMRGQNLTDARARENIALSREKALNPTAAKTPLSATAQKELFEADETANSANNVIGMLKQALSLNDKSYSGVGAKPLAILRSNTPFMKDSPEANATIDLDNLMTGQALESLKATFGGMPTEGERKILLDIQASADKTPEQRKSILNRAIQAAERRQKFTAGKAKALREGTYFTEGIPEDAQTPSQQAPNSKLKKNPDGSYNYGF